MCSYGKPCRMGLFYLFAIFLPVLTNLRKSDIFFNRCNKFVIIVIKLKLLNILY